MTYDTCGCMHAWRWVLSVNYIQDVSGLIKLVTYAIPFSQGTQEGFKRCAFNHGHQSECQPAYFLGHSSSSRDLMHAPRLQEMSMHKLFPCGLRSVRDNLLLDFEHNSLDYGSFSAFLFWYNALHGEPISCATFDGFSILYIAFSSYCNIPNSHGAKPQPIVMHAGASHGLKSSACVAIKTDFEA
ncbi:hypothetical protein VNO77_26997 [Canavalia gladiata]|uniref:Uncharacterized protein n=1 Tax=Canavalia gladiata TaxID=3824 RepID=A0AAN9KT88_CANGL